MVIKNASRSHGEVPHFGVHLFPPRKTDGKTGGLKCRHEVIFLNLIKIWLFCNLERRLPGKCIYSEPVKNDKDGGLKIHRDSITRLRLSGDWVDPVRSYKALFA